ncbi:uncharacterized protein LOC111126691 isoform X4 [Crassostrea virginica]
MSVLALVFLLCTLVDVAFGHNDYAICNGNYCMTCTHCDHWCPPPLKMTCYNIVKGGGGGGGGGGNHGHGDCFCQSESYCDGFYTCHDWNCPSPGLTSVCNPRTHSCTCVATAETCSGNDVTSCHVTCNVQEKLICDHGVCSCKPLDYCDHDNTHCANLVCRAGSGEVPLCYANLCQCGLIVDKCLGNDTSTCQHLHCDGQFPHKACINGECGCQLNPSCSTSSDCTENNTMIDFGHGTVLLCQSVLNLHPYCYNGGCYCFPGVETNTSTIATTTPSPSTKSSTTKPIATTTTKTNTACVSESDCDHSNTFYELYSLKIPCPPGDAQCVNNSCFCNPFLKDTTAPQTAPTTTTTTTTTGASSRYCHQCGDLASNIPCDTRTIYLGNLQKCASGNFCMTDILQTSSEVSIYKRCVDELTCRNEWMAQTSDQDRCLRYAEGAVPGQYTCHYCCTTDGCNSNMVPDAKTFYTG